MYESLSLRIYAIRSAAAAEAAAGTTHVAHLLTTSIVISNTVNPTSDLLL